MIRSPQNSVLRVLVVEDSGVVAEFLKKLLDSDPHLQVVGIAHDGEEAVGAVQRMRPDVVTMDIHMPKLDGFDATRSIMEKCPTPIVIVSGSSSIREAATSFRAVEVGALAVVARPPGFGHPEHESAARHLLDTIRLMSEVKVIRRWPWFTRSAAAPPRDVPRIHPVTAASDIQIIAIAASTGGPLALQTVLSGIAKPVSVPILIVQHMTPGFVQGFAEWLSAASKIAVSVATHGELLQAGRAYVAPDDLHMGAAGNRILLSTDEREGGMRPSGSFLFRSIARSYGPRAAGVLLTGMGSDGALELKQLRDAGGITMAQDEESSVVHGMPGQAIKIDAASMVLSPEGIAGALSSILTRS